jgi:hypothetical protein
MNLDNILKNKLKKLSVTPKTKAKKKYTTPEQKHMENIKYVIRLIKTGDINIKKKSHKILLNVAVKEGFVDKELNIIKEP